MTHSSMQLPSGPCLKAGSNTKGCITVMGSSWNPYLCLSLATCSGGFHPAETSTSAPKAILASLDSVGDLPGQ